MGMWHLRTASAATSTPSISSCFERYSSSHNGHGLSSVRICGVIISCSGMSHDSALESRFRRRYSRTRLNIFTDPQILHSCRMDSACNKASEEFVISKTKNITKMNPRTGPKRLPGCNCCGKTFNAKVCGGCKVLRLVKRHG